MKPAAGFSAAAAYSRIRISLLPVLAIALLSLIGIPAVWGQTKLPRVGILNYGATSAEEAKHWAAPFRRALAARGWTEHHQVEFEYRQAVGDPALLRQAAIELSRSNVDVIYAESAPTLRAAYAATVTVPIVGIDFTTDPIAEGYIESYARPGRNVTGVFLDAPDFSGKWIELLKAIVPDLSRVAVLWDPSPGTTHLRALKALAGRSGLQLQVIEVRRPSDIARAFSEMRGRPQALIILPSPMIYIQSKQLAGLTLKHRLLATSMARQFADAGGVIAYGPQLAALDERTAAFVASILGGAKPGDLPVERPSKFDLIVNLKTAKGLGLTIPQSLLLQADEVIR